MSSFNLRGSLLDGYGAGEALDSVDDILKYFWDQPGDLDAPVEVTSQFGTTPDQTKVNPESMNVQFSRWAKQRGTFQSLNVNADAEKRARIRESKRKYWEKKEKERRENGEKVVELDKQNHHLREIIARLEKEAAEAKIKQQNEKRENAEKEVEFAEQMNDLRKDNERLVKEVAEGKIKQENAEQRLSYIMEVVSRLKKEVGRMKKEVKGQTMKLDALCEKLVASPEATDVVAKENKQLRGENEKLKRELKKLRFTNDALCDKMLREDEQ
ncbi:hypothetical protein OIU78_009625 [Salix suchowensis]|nr:hypothetical protein OIU78_009625 [Salix suchowensis]